MLVLQFILIDGGIAVVFNSLVIAGGIGVEISSLK